MNIAIIFAGGIGQRMKNNNDTMPKQFLKVYNKPIIVYTLEQFQQNKNIDKIYISIVDSHLDHMGNLVNYYKLDKVAGIIPGGFCSQDSIYRALKLAEQENPGDSVVLIHDGVRPNITQQVIDLNISNTLQYGSAITCTPATETILFSVNGKTPEKVPIRRETFAAQAPQSFRLKDIIEAHEFERQRNPEYADIVDACTMMKKQGKETSMIRGNTGNIKITTIEDLYILRALITCREDMIAFGLDKAEE